MQLELSESDMEEIITKHPEIIEKGLTLKGRQVNVQGVDDNKRVVMDLLFEDKFGDSLIVELKKGTVTRNHVAQLMDYSGAIPERKKRITRAMLVANFVPLRWKRALDNHAIEYRELANRDFIGFLKEKDPKLLKEFKKRQLQSVSPVSTPERSKEIAPTLTIGRARTRSNYSFRLQYIITQDALEYATKSRNILNKAYYRYTEKAEQMRNAIRKSAYLSRCKLVKLEKFQDDYSWKIIATNENEILQLLELQRNEQNVIS